MARWSTYSSDKALHEFARLDPQYFDPTNLEAVAELEVLGAAPLLDSCDVLSGGSPSGGYTEDGDWLVVRAGDLVAPLIYDDCRQAFLRCDDSTGMLTLEAGDVLISSIGLGSIGKVSLVMEARRLVTVPEVTVVRAPDERGPALFAYLRTPVGQQLLLREVTGATGQQHLLKTKVETVLVPEIPQRVWTRLRRICDEIWQSERELHRLQDCVQPMFFEGLDYDLPLTP